MPTRSPRFLLLLLLLLHLPATPASAAGDLEGRRDAAARARAQVDERLAAHDRGLRARVRALYKVSAFGDLPHWVDEHARDGTLHRRGAARRVILRDLEERRLLRAELAALDADLARLDRDAARAADLRFPRPRPGSMRAPSAGVIVAPPGVYRDGRTHLRLLRRGVELATSPRPIVAAAAGQVLHAGPVQGLGIAVIIDHGQGVVSVTGRLASTTARRGDRLISGEPVGRAAGPTVSFEVRLGGRPIDPVPLFAPRASRAP
jgi:murein DD-endopeptidase MepM/ murein hydrolase activator NlpD